MRSHAHADADDNAHEAPKTEAAPPPAPPPPAPTPKAASLEDRVAKLEKTVARIVPLIGEESLDAAQNEAAGKAAV
jgi:hypothetical protein